MPTAARTAATTALIVLAAGSAWAHHGWGGYDSTRLVSLEGTLDAVEYRSPHVSARLPAEGKAWTLILAPPSRMTSRGLPEGGLAAGQKVRVEGYVHRSEPAEFRAERILVNGQTVELR
ncbi:MAG TPA: DUF6152 family protein [Azospirillum sp.]|nr:DUF6152 family protein [Azospirillum sp.]